MTNTFTLSNINKLHNEFLSSSIAHDWLPVFLNTFHWSDIYETEDNSLVFVAGDENRIEIEFFNFNNPLIRTYSIMYFENSKPHIINSNELS